MNTYHDPQEETKSKALKRSRSYIYTPFYFIVLIWFVFWLDNRFSLDLYTHGIYPLHFKGLQGIIFTPLIHGNLTHLANNTIPLIVLGAGLYYFYPRIANTVALISWGSSGLVVWLIGRESFHIGASGLIYALAGFIFLSGVLRRQANLLALSLLVVFLYGSLVWGLFPIEETISWEAHLAGFMSGFALAIYYRKTGPQRRTYSWELEEEENEEVEEIFVEEEDHKGDDGNEVWSQYANSKHGIRYIYKTKPKDKQE